MIVCVHLRHPDGLNVTRVKRYSKISLVLASNKANLFKTVCYMCMLNMLGKLLCNLSDTEKLTLEVQVKIAHQLSGNWQKNG